MVPGLGIVVELHAIDGGDELEAVLDRLEILDGGVPKAAATMALALLTCAMGVGQFISPIFYSNVNGILGLEGPRASWVVAAVCFSVAFVAALMKVSLWPKKNEIRSVT